MKTGVIDVGGGLRGIYAAGVFDYCMDKGIHFDVGIGVSAGSANIAAYLAGQRGRNYVFYTKYALRKQYMSVGNFLKTRNFVNLDYAYGTLSNSDGEYPLDYQAMSDNPSEFLVVSSDAESGEAKYFTKDDFSQDHYEPCKASCALPFFCRPYPIGGRLYYDGALSDPVPVEKALQEGCGKLVLILTKPRDTVRTSEKDDFFARRVRKKYPKAAENLHRRARRYNESVALAKELEKEGKALIVAPSDTCGLDTLTRDEDALKRFYAMGLEDARAIPTFLSAG